MLDKVFSLASGFDDWVGEGLSYVSDLVSGSDIVDTVFDAGQDVVLSSDSSGFLDIAKSGFRTMSRMQSRGASREGDAPTSYRRDPIRPERFRNPMYSGQGGGTRGGAFGYNMPQISNAHARLAARIGSGGLSDPQLDKVFRTAVNLQQGRRTIGTQTTAISRRVVPAQPAQVTKQKTRR